MSSHTHSRSSDARVKVVYAGTRHMVEPLEGRRLLSGGGYEAPVPADRDGSGAAGTIAQVDDGALAAVAGNSAAQTQEGRSEYGWFSAAIQPVGEGSTLAKFGGEDVPFLLGETGSAGSETSYTLGAGWTCAEAASDSLSQEDRARLQEATDGEGPFERTLSNLLKEASTVAEGLAPNPA